MSPEIVDRNLCLDLEVVRGSVPEFIEQLVSKSTQPHIIDNTPNDATVRFASPEAFDEWYEPSTAMYMLLGKSATDLAGVVWHKAAVAPQNDIQANHTFAIRLYEGYQGKGLARPLMIECLRDYMDLPQAAVFHGVWLQTRPQNKAAVRTYTKFGYRQINPEPDDTGRLTMVLSAECARRIVSGLPAPKVKGD